MLELGMGLVGVCVFVLLVLNAGLFILSLLCNLLHIERCNFARSVQLKSLGVAAISVIVLALLRHINAVG